MARDSAVIRSRAAWRQRGIQFRVGVELFRGGLGGALDFPGVDGNVVIQSEALGDAAGLLVRLVAGALVFGVAFRAQGGLDAGFDSGLERRRHLVAVRVWGSRASRGRGHNAGA